MPSSLEWSNDKCAQESWNLTSYGKALRKEVPLYAGCIINAIIPVVNELRPVCILRKTKANGVIPVFDGESVSNICC